MNCYRTELRATEHRPLTLALVLFCLCLAPIAYAEDATPESTPPAEPSTTAAGDDFETISFCTSFAEELSGVTEESKQLKTLLGKDTSDRDAMLAGIFQGTQLMLALGERMFEASDQYEEKCKAALREANKGAEIVRVYDAVLEPTLRSYEFLVQVKEVAERLKDDQTAEEMTEAIRDYKASAQRLVDFCLEDLPEDSAKERCGEFRRKLDARLK